MYFSLYKPLLMYGLAVLFLCLEMAIQISPNVMALHLMKDLKLNSLDLGLMSGAYFYTYALMQIPAGLLLDKYKAKFVITGALIVCLTGTFLFSHSNSLYVLTFSRLLMGAGSAFAFISVLVVTADLFPHKYFSGMTSVTQFFACLGAVAGTYYLNKIVLFYGWRPTMQIFTGAAILLACLTAMCLNYTKQKSLAIKKSDTPLSIKEKLKKILHQRQTWWIGLYSFLTWAPMTGFASLWSNPFLKKSYGLSSQQASLFTSFLWIGLALSGVGVGLASEYFKSRKKGMVFLSFIGLIAFGLILSRLSGQLWILGICLMITGASCSAQILGFTSVKENNADEQKGLAVAINNIMVVLSGALYQPLIGWLLKKSAFYLHVPFLSHYSFRLALLPIFFSYIAAVIIAVFFIKETFKENTA